MERLIENKPSVPAGKPAKVGLLAVGSLAALTAASARISSLRRRGDGDA